MNTNLFRKVGLSALFLLLATAVVWAFAGSIATKASGQGVIVRTGGVLSVVSRGSGLILSLDVKVGDKIRANQIVARIAEPVLVEKRNPIEPGSAAAGESQRSAAGEGTRGTGQTRGRRHPGRRTTIGQRAGYQAANHRDQAKTDWHPGTDCQHAGPDQATRRATVLDRGGQLAGGCGDASSHLQSGSRCGRHGTGSESGGKCGQPLRRRGPGSQGRCGRRSRCGTADLEHPARRSQPRTAGLPPIGTSQGREEWNGGPGLAG